MKSLGALGERAAWEVSPDPSPSLHCGNSGATVAGVQRCGFKCWSMDDGWWMMDDGWWWWWWWWWWWRRGWCCYVLLNDGSNMIKLLYDVWMAGGWVWWYSCYSVSLLHKFQSQWMLDTQGINSSTLGDFQVHADTLPSAWPVGSWVLQISSYENPHLFW